MSDASGTDTRTSAQDPKDVAGVTRNLPGEDPGKVAIAIIELEELAASSDDKTKDDIKSSLKNHISEKILFKNRGDNIIFGRGPLIGNFGSTRMGREPGDPKILRQNNQDRFAIVELNVKTEDGNNTINIFGMEKDDKGHWRVSLWYNIKQDTS
jgi:hypothetical protein